MTSLEEQIGAFRDRRLDHIIVPYVFCDATCVKARSPRAGASQAVIVAFGVAAGTQEVLDVDVGDSEDETCWTAFLHIPVVLATGPMIRGWVKYGKTWVDQTVRRQGAVHYWGRWNHSISAAPARLLEAWHRTRPPL